MPARGRQALVLLPEIALTAGSSGASRQRFGARPAEWHSGVTMTERRRLWRMVGEGGAQLVVGARSALFLPYRDLGLIVVDEEHDTSYKQEDGVLYNARDMAVLRASICGRRWCWPRRRPRSRAGPTPRRGSMRARPAARFGVRTSRHAGDRHARRGAARRPLDLATLKRGRSRRGCRRASRRCLFLNRRGYAPVTLCRACGHQIGCDHCDARMVEHRFLKRLMCHQCGETRPCPTTCPACGVEGRSPPSARGRAAGRGGARAFPEARHAVLSSDLFGSARALKAEIEAIAAGRPTSSSARSSSPRGTTSRS
jgi:primosomal protein N' (replication factor Y) (superfamily II helicase)